MEYWSNNRRILQPGMALHGQGIDGQDFGLGSRPAKNVAFQALLPQTKSVAIPVEQLDDGVAAVAKAEQVASERIEL